MSAEREHQLEEIFSAARNLPPLLLVSAGFFGYATFWSSSFLPFILYEE
jgi:hypothetical protein